MKVTPALLIIGSFLVFWASIFILVILPAMTVNPPPSDIWRPLTEIEQQGHSLYVDNGCSYCHSQYIRSMDWGVGAQRIAQAGDYVDLQPIPLGSERTGPDLSQEGGEHSDDWNLAHFVNPRNTSPISLMPSWEFLGKDKINKLTAYVQSEGRKDADFRVNRQRTIQVEALKAFNKSTDENIQWLHSKVPPGWRVLPNPYPASEEGLLRGKKMYQEFCIGCHGLVGDGQGPAAEFLKPTPLNFTSLRRNLIENKYIGGILYYQIMNGITGTAMPYFKRALESEKIWDLSNYVAVNFIGYTDADIEPKGIDASYELNWKNDFQPPDANDVNNKKHSENLKN
jgi:cytochrome c oxidase cbb3-type subunit 2/cytochrome c oxidase cbb3-type subunit I/II